MGPDVKGANSPYGFQGMEPKRFIVSCPSPRGEAASHQRLPAAMPTQPRRAGCKARPTDAKPIDSVQRYDWQRLRWVNEAAAKAQAKMYCA